MKEIEQGMASILASQEYGIHPCRNIVCSEWYSNDNKAYKQMEPKV
jgi:hypothetical protein